MSRLPGLDLLRAIAIIWVMLFHAFNADLGTPIPFIARHGWMGVDLFFVLSGFLIGYQLLKPLAAGERLALGGFYLRRAFRILPAFWVVLALYFLWPPFREQPGIQPWWQFATFTENLLIDYHRNKAFSHAWSLCVEEHFYLFFPLLAWALMRRPSVKKAIAVCAVIVIGGMALRGWIWWHDLASLPRTGGIEGNFWQRYIEQIYYPTYTRLDGLLAGVVLAMVKVFRPALWARAMENANRVLLAGLIGFAAALWLFEDRFGLVPTVIGFPLLSASLALIVMALAKPDRTRVPGVTAIAAIAYSTYLTHKQIFHLIHEQWGTTIDAHGVIAFFVYGLTALAAGALLYVAVERPFLRLRERIVHGRAQPELVAKPQY